MLAQHLENAEQAGYLEFSGAHLYTVLHRAAAPAARVLLVGPFAPDRHFSYVPWVRWARFLAAGGMEALRFDYRGVGESTGVFQEMGFGAWKEDVEFLAAWLQSRSPNVPLVLHGLGLGAVLAGTAFAAGAGDALLCWSGPKSANEVLRRELSRRVAVEQMSRSANERKPLAEYVRQLEDGESLEVRGYEWSSELWRESFQFQGPVAPSDEGGETSLLGRRPVRLLKLDSSAALLTGASYVYSLNPNLNQLFTDNFDWMAKAVAADQV
jgi:alpha/beta superfamily hydrolase